MRGYVTVLSGRAQCRVICIYFQSAETTTKERLQRAKSFIQNKIPMPNMVSVIVRETISGTFNFRIHVY